MKGDDYPNKDRVFQILERNKEARERARQAEAERAAIEAEKGEAEKEVVKEEVMIVEQTPAFVEEQDVYQVGAYEEGIDDDGDDPMTQSAEADEHGYVGGGYQEDNGAYQVGDDDEDELPPQPAGYAEPPRLGSPSPSSSSPSVAITDYANLQGKGFCDWSGRFTSLIEEIKNQKANTPFKRRIEVNEELMRLSSDFLLSAELYGKTIISEMFLPLEEKTIKVIFFFDF